MPQELKNFLIWFVIGFFVIGPLLALVLRWLS